MPSTVIFEIKAHFFRYLRDDFFSKRIGIIALSPSCMMALRFRTIFVTPVFQRAEPSESLRTPIFGRGQNVNGSEPPVAPERAFDLLRSGVNRWRVAWRLRRESRSSHRMCLRNHAGSLGPGSRASMDRGCWSFPVETSTGKLVGSLAMYFRQPREPTPAIASSRPH
jgi:hypothetical protein